MNGLTEQDYADAFGVELPEEVPEDTETTTGQADEPETMPETPTGAPESAPEGEEEPETQETAERQEQGTEERRRQAYGRRQREAAAERQAMLAAAQARVDAAYAEMFRGQVNPHTGQPIRSEADYRAYQQAEAEIQRGNALRGAGIDPAAVQSIVEEAVRPLREQVERQNLASMGEMARNVNRQAEAAIRQGVENIRTLYGAEVQSVQDILAMPTGAAFNGYVQKGLSIEDAYYLANRESVDRRRMEAAKRAGINQATGKGHIGSPVAAAGETPYVATAEQVEAYREMNPGATIEEINAAYGAYYKN